METHFDTIKNYLLELNYSITHEDKEDGVIVIQKLEEGINNLILGIANGKVICDDNLVYEAEDIRVGLFKE